MRYDLVGWCVEEDGRYFVLTFRRDAQGRIKRLREEIECGRVDDTHPKTRSLSELQDRWCSDPCRTVMEVGVAPWQRFVRLSFNGLSGFRTETWRRVNDGSGREGTNYELE